MKFPEEGEIMTKKATPSKSAVVALVVELRRERAALLGRVDFLKARVAKARDGGLEAAARVADGFATNQGDVIAKGIRAIKALPNLNTLPHLNACPICRGGDGSACDWHFTGGG